MNDTKMLKIGEDLNSARVFLPSSQINIFPCSRRGYYIDNSGSRQIFDPEARLNTERTNRLRTAVNGFTDSFIDTFVNDIKQNEDETETTLSTGTLVFVLAGYRIEIKNFDPQAIANKLGLNPGNTIYAHLSLHDEVPLDVPDYYTEILYRQSSISTAENYLDVYYDDDTFFMGVSFTGNPYLTDSIVIVTATSEGVKTVSKKLTEKNLALYNVVEDATGSTQYELVQTSLLPKIEHGETEDSIKISGDFTVKHGEQTSFKVTENKTTLGPTEISELDVTGDFTIKQVSGEGEEISFEITKHRVGTVNVPLHITKGTTIDGGVNLNAGVRAFGLIVGDSAEGDIFPNGTIKAKGHIETPTLEATTSVKTPALDVKTIENKVDNTGVSINDTLNITTGHTVAADTLKVNAVNSRRENDTIAIGSPITVAGKATLSNGLAVTNGDTTLKKLTAEATTLGSLTVDNVTVNSGSVISTPTLKVDTITSRSTASDAAVTVDKPLKVNNTLNITNKATLNNGLELTSGDALIKSNLKVEDNINVGDLTDTEKVTTNNGGNIVAKNDIIAKNDLEASNDISAGGYANIAKDLTVGTDNDTNTGTITAKKLVKAPILAVKEIKNEIDNTGVSVDDTLSVTANHSINAETLNADTLNVDKVKSRAPNSTITIESPISLSNSLTVQDGDTSLKKLTADETIINQKLTANNGVEVASGDLSVKEGNISLKSGGLSLIDGTEPEKEKLIASNIQATNNATIYDLDVGTNTDTNTLKVNNYINVGTPASPTDFTGNISAKNEITAEARLRVPNTFRAESSDQTTYVQKLSATENVIAKEISAEKITQNDKAIPAIGLVQKGTTYQLQITLDASKK